MIFEPATAPRVAVLQLCRVRRATLGRGAVVRRIRKLDDTGDDGSAALLSKLTPRHRASRGAVSKMKWESMQAFV